MKIAVIGAGAIGGLVAGYFKDKGFDVTLIARTQTAEKINQDGLYISGVRGNLRVRINTASRIDFPADLVIFATKTQDIEEALQDNVEAVKTSIVLTTQNGLQAEKIVSGFIPKENIISSIVMFGSTSLNPGEVIHNFEGSWIIGKAFSANDKKVIDIAGLLNNIFPAVISEDIRGMKYLKVFVNANNCIPAILGLSMQEAFLDLDISSISIGVWKEGAGIINNAGINLVSLPDFPLERMLKLVSMPTQEAAKIYSGIMTNLSKEPIYGSILQSIKRGKPSEVDYINGEFVRLAEENNISAPLNKKLVSMVHQVEKTGKFLTTEELIANTKSLLN